MSEANVQETVSELLFGEDAEEETLETTPQEEDVLEEDEEQSDGQEEELEEESVEDQETDEEADNEEFQMPETVADFAKAVDVEPEVLYNLEIGIGDGEKPVKIGQLKDAYLGAVRESTTLKSQIEDLSVNLNNTVQQAQSTSQMNDQMIGAVADMKFAEYQESIVDWEGLEKSDAGEAALFRQRIEQLKQTAGQNYAVAKQAMEQQHQQNMANYRMQQRQMLLQGIPEWQDQSVMAQETASIRQLAAEYGFSPQELSSVEDSRVVKILRDFMKVSSRANDAKKIAKKVQKAPKMLRGGKSMKSKVTSKKIDKIVDRGIKSSRYEDKLSAVGALLSQET